MHCAGFFLTVRLLAKVGQTTVCPDICLIVSPRVRVVESRYAQQVSALIAPRAECALFIRRARVYPQPRSNEVVVVVHLVIIFKTSSHGDL